MGNTFSNEQFDFLYSDYDFLKFLSTFYSTYEITDQTADIILSDESGIVDMNIYIRIVLANAEEFIVAINEVRKKMSLCNRKEDYEYIGEIKGRLNISKYVKQMVSRSTPHVYPCVVKEKNYGTPENIYLLFYAYVFSDRFKKMAKYIQEQKMHRLENSRELGKIAKYISDLTSFISCPELQQFSKQIIELRKRYGEKLPANYYDQFVHRLKTNKIVNLAAYVKAFNWVKKFSKNMVVFNESSIKMLRYDEEKFCDRLFEIWILYSIKKTLINEHACTLVEEYGLMDKRMQYTFVLERDDGEFIKLYFQKGEGLFWTDSVKTTWKYIRGDKTPNLAGIPDISVEIMSSPSKLIMIDAKNKIRTEGSNSAEIYKMIGYLDNFKKRYDGITYRNEFKKAILVFRNDDVSFIERLVNDVDDNIIALSVAPEVDIDLNDNQYIILCEEILQG